MSETTGAAAGRPITDTPPHRTTGRTGADQNAAHESFSFVCLRCGHGWEQSYDIAHQVDALGRTVVTYTSGGRPVPSPFDEPTCDNCGGHVVRIMRPGRVSTVLETLQGDRPSGSTRAPHHGGGPATGARRAEARSTGSAGRSGHRSGHRPWHPPGLRHLLHRARRAQ